jgi:oligoribonuclease
MTGLDLTKDKLIEIAVIVTDGQDLSKRIMGPEIIIHCDTEIIDGMDKWCTDHHGSSGLTQKVKDSQISMEQAESQVLEFLKADCQLKNREG